MTPTTSLQPLEGSEFGPAQASHLLRRTSFAATPDQVRELVAMGPDQAVSSLLNIPATAQVDPIAQLSLDPQVRRPMTDEERRQQQMARRTQNENLLHQFRLQTQERDRRDREMATQLRNWWVQTMAQSPSGLLENLTLFWHGHYATRQRDVRDAYKMAMQNRMLRLYAFEPAALLAGIVRDPAMLRFLNNDRNRRQQPNENLAREIMELFALGKGQYSERDIQEAARALTGYHVQHHDFVFRQAAHDNGTKTIFGRRGNFNGDDLVRILLEHNTCAAFLTFRLYRHFVADLPEDPREAPPWARNVITLLAAQLRRHRYQLQPVLGLLLRSRHFYDPALMGNKIKSPAQVAVGTVRMLQTPLRDPQRLWQAMQHAGQLILDPPTVAGWKSGPGWINTSALFARQNLCAFLIAGIGQPAGQRENWEPSHVRAMIQQLDDPQAVDALVDWLVGHRVDAGRREPLKRFVAAQGGLRGDATLVQLLLLITAMPEYQLT